MAGTHKKRIERYITFDEESERYRINLSCIRIWILVLGEIAISITRQQLQTEYIKGLNP